MKTTFWVIFGLVVATVIAIILGLPIAYMADKVFLLFPFLSSSRSGDILLGVFIGLVIACFPWKKIKSD